MFATFAAWLTTLFDKLVALLYNVIVDIFNLVILAFAQLGIAASYLLPSIDFAPPQFPVVANFLGYLNWFIPINHIIVSLGLYSTAIVLYFTIGPILRWVKVIQ